MKAPTLPCEVLLQIFSYLPWNTLLVCARVSHLWNKIAADDYLWEFHLSTQITPATKSIIDHIKTENPCYSSKDHFFTFYSLQENWKRGRFQRYRSQEQSAVLCLCKAANKVILGAQNTSIRIFDLKDISDPLSGPQAQLPSKFQPKISSPPSKYIPPHLRAATSTPPIQVDDTEYLITNELSLQEEPIHFECEIKGALDQGHMDSVIAVKYSPEHNIICSASNDSTVRVWQMEESKTSESGVNVELLHILRGHERSVRVLDFYNPEQNNFETLLAASGSKDASVRIWNINRGEQVDRIPVEGTVHTLQFSDGLVACGDSMGVLCVYDLEAQRQRFCFTASGKWLTSLRFNVESNLIFAAGSDGRTRMFDIRTAANIGAIYDAEDHRSSINCIEIDVSRYLLINGAASIAGYDYRYPAAHKKIFTFPHSSWANALQLNGTRLVSALSDGYVGVHETDLANPHTQYKIRVGRKSTLSIHADHTKIIAGTWDGNCQVLNFCHKY